MNTAPTSAPSTRRNLTLEVCKLVAACFVVFIHVPFPGTTGNLILCLARFAVPMFFAISGWYSYRATPAKLLKRLGNILLLEAIGIAITLLWWMLAAAYTGRNVLEVLPGFLPDRHTMTRWILFNDNPFGAQFWYLSASAFAYGALWLYARLFRPRWGCGPLYALGLILLGTHLSMGEFSRFTGLEVFFRNYRTGLLYGLPMFILGLFLREYRDRLLAWLKTAYLVILLIGGLALTLTEWKLFGTYDFYMGLLLTVSALLLLTARYPGVPAHLTRPAMVCGSVSTVIFLVHMVMNDVYLGFFQWRVEQYCGTMEPWLQPLGVLALSLAAGFAWQILLCILKMFFRKK